MADALPAAAIVSGDLSGAADAIRVAFSVGQM